MKTFLIPLLAGSALFATASATTVTTELPPDSDAYGVFWCDVLSRTPAELALKKRPQATPGSKAEGGAERENGQPDSETTAEFNQKITLHIKDLAEWLSVVNGKGLTDEKSLDSFISHLMLVIDGVPLKHLQPTSITSLTPAYPYHNETKDEAEQEKVWRAWFIGNRRRDAENAPTLESFKHVEDRAGVEADMASAKGAGTEVQKAANQVRAKETPENTKDLAEKKADELRNR